MLLDWLSLFLNGLFLGPSFILSFLACMHSGLVPVPIASPLFVTNYIYMLKKKKKYIVFIIFLKKYIFNLFSSRPNPARNVIHACSEIILDCIPRLGLTDSTIVNQGDHITTSFIRIYLKYPHFLS